MWTTALGGVLGGLKGPSTYLGQVATRLGYQPNIGFGYTTAMTSSVHVLTDNVTSIQVAFPNFKEASGVDTLLTGNTTFTAAVSIFGAGSMTQMKWSGASSLSTALGITPLCDPIPLVASKGTRIKINVFRANSTDVPGFYPNGGNACNSAFGEGSWFGGTDQTMTTAQIADNSSPMMYVPCLIVAQTKTPSVLLIGDSKMVGYHDYTFDVTGDLGSWARALGKLGGIGYCNLGVFGEQASAFITNSAIRLTLAPYFSHIGCNYGINGLSTAASMYTNLQAVAALSAFSGKKFIQSTIEPFTSSTDSFATTANQSGNETVINPLNALILANSAGFSGVVDLASAVRDSATGFWKAPPAITDDGTHEITAGNIMIRDSGIFTAAKFSR